MKSNKAEIFIESIEVTINADKCNWIIVSCVTSFKAAGLRNRNWLRGQNESTSPGSMKLQSLQNVSRHHRRRLRWNMIFRETAISKRLTTRSFLGIMMTVRLRSISNKLLGESDIRQSPNPSLQVVAKLIPPKGGKVSDETSQSRKATTLDVISGLNESSELSGNRFLFSLQLDRNLEIFQFYLRENFPFVSHQLWCSLRTQKFRCLDSFQLFLRFYYSCSNNSIDFQ